MDSVLFEFGRINNARGLFGELKVTPFCDYKEQYEEVPCLIIEGAEYDISYVKYHNSMVILKLDGIDNVNDAEKFKNKIIYVRKSDLPPLPEGRYYIVDIIGCEVSMADGAAVGVVSDVIQSGANDLYEIKLDNNKTALIPKVSEFVAETDIENKKIVLTLQADELINL